MILAPEELDQVEEYIVARLPEVLKRDPAFLKVIREIAAEELVGLPEFQKIIADIDEIIARLDGLRSDMRSGFQRRASKLSNPIYGPLIWRSKRKCKSSLSSKCARVPTAPRRACS